MEVCVKTYVEAFDGSRRLINKAYVVMVALDEKECPTQVPGLLVETEEENKEWESALERKRARSKRKLESQD